MLYIANDSRYLLDVNTKNANSNKVKLLPTIPNYSLILNPCFLLYNDSMETKDKTAERARKFDECFAELSEQAQADLEALINYLAKDVLHKGGGLISAKELVMQVVRFQELHPIK